MILIAWPAVATAARLRRLAGYAGSGAALELLQSGRLALFLDGLGKMRDDLRGPALEAIDQAEPAELLSYPTSGTLLQHFADPTVRHRLPDPVDHAHAVNRLAWIAKRRHVATETSPPDMNRHTRHQLGDVHPTYLRQEPLISSGGADARIDRRNGSGITAFSVLRRLRYR